MNLYCHTWPAQFGVLTDNSIDAIVTDPPYEIGFMGKQWDRSGIAYNVDLWRELLRIAKPGAHLLAFGGTRTYHRMVCAIEDAGWQIRDQLAFLHGQGFPKSLDISKAIDAAAGADREVIGTGPFASRRPYADHAGQGRAFADDAYVRPAGHSVTAPATPDAEQWDGWGTALKPAFEPIVLARAPFTGTVAANVLQHGTGGLNIDGCRIGSGGQTQWATPRGGICLPDPTACAEARANEQGRWPANLLLDEHAAALLDAQTGDRSSGYMAAGTPRASTCGFNGAMPDQTLHSTYGDSGGASRFFYVSKPSRLERDAGLWDMPHQSAAELTNRQPGSAGLQSPRAGAARTSGGRNSHPTVKPLELMRYLVHLITPPGGTVLDPFMGSGTTGMACMLEGVDFIGIDQDAEYVELAGRRIAYIEQAMRYGNGAIEKPAQRARGQLALTFDEVTA